MLRIDLQEEVFLDSNDIFDFVTDVDGIIHEHDDPSENAPIGEVKLRMLDCGLADYAAVEWRDRLEELFGVEVDAHFDANRDDWSEETLRAAGLPVDEPVDVIVVIDKVVFRPTSRGQGRGWAKFIKVIDGLVQAPRNALVFCFTTPIQCSADPKLYFDIRTNLKTFGLDRFPQDAEIAQPMLERYLELRGFARTSVEDMMVSRWDKLIGMEPNGDDLDDGKPTEAQFVIGPHTTFDLSLEATGSLGRDPTSEYATAYAAKIWGANPEDDGVYTAIGECTICAIQLVNAQADGHELKDVLDVLDETAGLTSTLLSPDGSELSKAIQDAVDDANTPGGVEDLIVVTDLVLVPQARGRGLGAWALMHTLKRFARRTEIVVAHAFPMQHDARRFSADIEASGLDEFGLGLLERDLEKAKFGVAKPFLRLGMKPIGSSDLLVGQVDHMLAIFNRLEGSGDGQNATLQ